LIAIVENQENTDMAEANRKSENDLAWSRYFAHQLSESERAEARKRMLADLRQAKEEGVFREIEKLRGKIHWSVSLEDLRKDDD
jgi:hypothetical protein